MTHLYTLGYTNKTISLNIRKSEAKSEISVLEKQKWDIELGIGPKRYTRLGDSKMNNPDRSFDLNRTGRGYKHKKFHFCFGFDDSGICDIGENFNSVPCS